MSRTIITKKFNNWVELPDLSHLKKIENSYVRAAKGDIIYVSYVIENENVVAFGSAGYYIHDNYYGKNTSRQLWIEGLVSTLKGCGSIVLSELERELTNLAYVYNITHKIINVMSVDESIGFYEHNGYVECKTSSRFAGTGNTRMAKAIDNFSLESANVIKDRILDPCWIFTYIVGGRRTIVKDYVIIPDDIHHSQFSKYVLENYDKNIFNKNISTAIINQLIEYLRNGELD